MITICEDALAGDLDPEVADSLEAELFQNRWTILTPFESDDEHYAAAVARLSAFWRAFSLACTTRS